MNPAEQLARIAASKPPAPVRIYLLDRGQGSWPAWLCGRHLAKRKLERWEVKDVKDPAHPLLCDDRHLCECGEEIQP